MKKNTKGFTLIELLVVIAIIGLLATLSVVALNTARAKARDARRQADIKQIQTGLELYFTDKNDYPAGTSTAINAANYSLSLTNGIGTTSSGTVYMSNVPSAPLPADGNCTTTGNTYTYSYVAASGTNPPSYTLSYCLGSIGTVYTASPVGVR